MRNIIVTTPKKMMKVAEEEARACIEAGGGFYFRTFRSRPKEIEIGSKVFYVEDGWVRGYATISDIHHGRMKCGTTGRDWGEGWHVIMRADSWKWVAPVEMKGFMGWRYCDIEPRVVGGWLDPRPETGRRAAVSHSKSLCSEGCHFGD